MKFPNWLRVYGDQSFRGACPTEAIEQVTFFNKLRTEYPETYGKIGIHIKNEGVRNHGAAARDRASGMVAGAADIVIPSATPFVCELKRCDHTKSRFQNGQLDYLLACQEAGAFACVALGWRAAYAALLDNLGCKG